MGKREGLQVCPSWRLLVWEAAGGLVVWRPCLAASSRDKHCGRQQGLIKPWPIAEEVISELLGLEVASWLPASLTHGSLASPAALLYF